MSESIFEKYTAPWKQALITFLISFFVMGIAWLLDVAGIMEMERLFPWSICTAFLLFYGLFNSVLSLNADSFTRYWAQSIYSYLGLAVLNGLSAWLISGVSIDNAESYKFIFLVVTFGFLVFLSLVNFMKKIVQFAEREEWTQPRPRKRNRGSNRR